MSGRRVGVAGLDGAIVVTGWSHGGIGAIENGAFVSLPGDAATELIGQAVLDMSATYRPDASLLSKDALRSLYKRIGAKSQADFYRRAEIVHGGWSEHETMLRLALSRKSGGSYLLLPPDTHVATSDLTPTGIGEAARLALSRCRGSVRRGHATPVSLAGGGDAPVLRAERASDDGGVTTFGYKMAWLAVHGSRTPAEATQLLGLADAHQANWSEAVTAAYRDGPELLVTPTLIDRSDRPWTLVAGFQLFTADIDLLDLSRRVDGEVQWFGTHRIVESHGWARARAGELVRLFWTVGETGECGSIGRPDAVEANLGVPAPTDDQDSLFDAVLEADITEDTVMHVADHWSIDPQTLTDVSGLTAWVACLPTVR